MQPWIARKSATNPQNGYDNNERVNDETGRNGNTKETTTTATTIAATTTTNNNNNNSNNDDVDDDNNKNTQRHSD